MKSYLQDLRKLLSTHRAGLKIISSLLVLVLVFFAVPTVVYAEIADAIEDGADSSKDTDENEVSSASEIKGVLYEDLSKREETVKHFHLEDGSFVAAQYNYPVHVADEEGNLVDIDNSLSSGLFSSEYSTSNARIKFAKKITGNGTLFTLHEGGTKLTLSLEGANKGTKGSVTNGEDAENATELQKMMNLEKLSSSVLYKDILDGVDIEYVVHSLNVKENIIVKEQKDSYSYSFELKLNGLSAELLADGDIAILDADGKEKYRIPAPVVYDSAKIYAPASASAYTLTNTNGGKYTLTVTVDSLWMNSEDRVFPVTIDPAIISSSNQTHDTCLDEQDIYAQYGNSDRLPISFLQTVYWKVETLPVLPPSAYIYDAKINYYVEEVYTENYVAAYPVTGAWSESTTFGNMCDGDAGYNANKVLDIVNVTASCSEYGWNITDVVRRWYSRDESNNESNNGVAFRAIMEYPLDGSDPPEGEENGSTQRDLLFFYSSESFLAPVFYICYTENKGLEPYISYSTSSAGLGGDGLVKLYDGSLVLSINTLTAETPVASYPFTLYYDSAMANKYYELSQNNEYSIAASPRIMPYGFKVSINETIVARESVADGYTRDYLIYFDADGTEHAFYQSDGKYIDESGKQMSLEINSAQLSYNETISLKDGSGITRVFCRDTNSTAHSNFDRSWVLFKLVDEKGNQIIISPVLADEYDYVAVRVAGNNELVPHIEFSYNSAGMLERIYDPKTKEAVVLRYSENYNSTSFSRTNANYLRQIDYVKGSSATSSADWNNFYTSHNSRNNIILIGSATYDYIYGGYISKITDSLSGQSIEYSWENQKVQSVCEYSSSGAAGQSLIFSYGTGYTEIRSSGKDDQINTNDDIITRYSFDNAGRTISCYSTSFDRSTIYGATIGEYETAPRVKNSLKQQTAVDGTSVNYLLNGDFEEYGYDDTPTYWSKSGAVAKVVETAFLGEGEYCLQFTPTLGGSASISQDLRLKAGTYTFSIPYRTQISSGISGLVTVTSLTESGYIHSEEIPLNPTLSNGIDCVFSTTFDISDYESGGDDVRLAITFISDSSVIEAPMIQLDRLMLERNLGYTDFNLVSNGGFDPSVIDSSGNIIPIAWTTYGDNADIIDSAEENFGRVGLINAIIGPQNYISQTIFELDYNDCLIYDNDPQYSNVGYDYIVSGFAKATSPSYSESSEFCIEVAVTYYLGEYENEVTVVHSFPFNVFCSDWQFTAGTFNTAYEDYRFVRKIEIFCVFENQHTGFALFDNISVTNATGTDITKYTYNSEGLVKTKENVFYKEYYEYTEDNKPQIIINNHGEIQLIEYDECGFVDSVVIAEFSDTPPITYPLINWFAENLSNFIATRTTIYTYNSYGQCTDIVSTVYDDYIEFTAGAVTINISQPSESNPPIKTEYEYNNDLNSVNFGAVTKEIDSLGNATIYRYYESDGRLWFTGQIPAGSSQSYSPEGVLYSYDFMGRVTSTRTVEIQGYDSQNPTFTYKGEAISYEYDNRNLVDNLSSGNTDYSFTYDSFGNATSLKADALTIISYSYNPRNGKLNSVNYRNGLTEEYVYNDLEMLSEVWYNLNGTRTKAYEYEYTASGMLARFTDYVNGKGRSYKYDVKDRIIASNEYSLSDYYNDVSAVYSYNDKGELFSFGHRVNYTSVGAIKTVKANTTYLYNTDGSLYSATHSGNRLRGTEYFTYDEHDRIVRSTLSFATEGYPDTKLFRSNEEYLYQSTEDNTQSSYRISSHITTVNGVETYRNYTYDHLGNITKIEDDLGREIRYVYDHTGQLIREDNELLSKTFTYEYDSAGNITKKNTYSLCSEGAAVGGLIDINAYSYSSDDWGDLLTSFDGNAITYDAAGNPLTYPGGFTFTWQGKQLVGATQGNNVYSFTYNESGLRTSKTVNGVTTNYYWVGSLLAGEEKNGNFTRYLYDAKGSILAMQYHSSTSSENAWTTYWFEKNLQGDVVGVYNSSGTKLVSYVYDAFGNCTATTLGTGASSLANSRNPFRYRGYYYDKDLEMYYLQSRYYDQKIGRFIQPADVSTLNPSSINGLNLYSYANNNPIGIAYSSSGAGFGTSGGTIGGNSSSWFKTLPAVPWLVENATTMYGTASSLISGAPILAHYFKYASIINDEFKLYGISKWKTSLQLSNVNLKMGALEGALIGVNVLIDMYDSYQRGVSTEGILLGGTLTAASSIVMLYLNKGIMWSTTSIGTAICPGLGTAIGFTVGLGISLVVDWQLGELISDWIDSITS